MYKKILVLEIYAVVQIASALWATARLLVTRVSATYLVDEFMFSRCLFLILLNEMRILGESNVLRFLLLVLMKGMRKLCESRSSHQRYSTKKVVLKNFLVFLRKHLCCSPFLIKLQAFRSANLLKWAPTLFLVNIVKPLRAPISKSICKRLLLWDKDFLG